MLINRQPARAERERLGVRKKQPHRRVKGYGEDSGNRHGEIFRERQRLEQTPFLRLECKDRHEGDGDDQQREEARPAHFLDGLDHDPVIVALAPLGVPLLEFLVSLFHHYNGGIHHHADGNRDSAEGHDVRRHPGELHQNEGNDYGDGDGKDRDQSARDVPEEHEDDRANDEEFFREGLLQGVDRAENEFRAVIGRDDLDAGRQGLLDVVQALFHSFDHVQGVLAETHDDDASDDLASAIEFRSAAPQIGAQRHPRHIAHQDGRASPVRAHRDALDVRDGVGVAARTGCLGRSGIVRPLPAVTVRHTYHRR